MKKPIIQGIIIILAFIFIWISLTQIKWISILDVEEKTDNIEQKLGELLVKEFEKNQVDNVFVNNTLDSLVTHICKTNEINKDYLKVKIVKNQEINALALPDGHLIVYSNLILHTKNQEELLGVICHEIAHIQLHHIMKKLVREIGISVLISVVTGDNSNSLGEVVKVLSSSAFDRNLEKEADLKATDYLIKAEINPDSFANFLYGLSIDSKDNSIDLSWISTHPNLEERAKYIIEHSKNTQTSFKNIITEETWTKLKEELNKIE